MTRPIEREYKMLLTKEEYEKLLSSYDFPIIKDQTNIYYDTDENTVKNLPGAVRIRKVNGKNIFTLKVRNDASSHFEYEKEVIEDQLPDVSDPQVIQWLKDHGIVQKNLKESYTIHTIRHILRTKDAEISLDENFFDGGHDYEIEYEYKADHAGLPEFNRILSIIGKKYEKNCLSKIARAASFKH